MISPGRATEKYPMEVITMPQSFSSVYLHIIFGTAGRMRCISGEMRQRLYSCIGGILREKGCKLLKAGGTKDHVHLLISFPRDISIANLLREVKSSSSKWVHETYSNMKWFKWQDGYGVFSVSQSLLGDVMRYIERQEEHHKKITFREEFLRFLERHNVKLDQRYILK